VCAVIGLVGAFGYVTVAPKVYAATASVYVLPTGADQSAQLANSRTQGTVNLDTEAQIVQSLQVATIAAHRLHSPLTPYDLTKEINVTVPPNSAVLDISCKAPSPTGAADCANAFAAAYLQNRSASATATINGQLSKLSAKVSTLQKQATTLRAQIGGLPKNSAKSITDQTQLKYISGQLSSLTSKVTSLNGLAAQTSGGSVISQASPPNKPASPKKLLVLPSGLAAGLVIGLLVAFLVDRRDKVVRNSQDVERLLGAPVLLKLPPSAFGREVSVVSPRSKTGHAFTELAHSVSAALGEGNHVLLVAGCTPGRAGSAVAANLAATLARTHSEVVLVCADLEGTVAPRLLGVPEGGDGLAEVVAGAATIQEAARSTGIPGLWVITPGNDPTLAVYHLQHDTARALMAQLRQDVGYVVIEAQATDEGADTFGLGEFADAALVVAETSRTTRPEISDCARRLARLRTLVLGAAVAPALSSRLPMRPPRVAAAPRPVPEAGGRDGASARLGRDDTVSQLPAGAADRKGRPVRTSDGHGGRADRVGS
jgi:Mrp family chromosome partitioning ATPase